MTLVFTLLTIVVLGLVVAVALGRIGGGLDAPESSLPPTGLPDGELTANDLEQVRFAPALRGYRMDQVDAALDRLGSELARRDAELERLRAVTPIEPPGHPGTPYAGIPVREYTRAPAEWVNPVIGASAGEGAGAGDGAGEGAASNQDDDLFTPRRRSAVPPAEA